MNIKLEGIDQVEAKLDKAREQLAELYKTLAEINAAMEALEIKISQPTAGTIG